jgi:tRNA-specific 2-thiouridylase
VISHSGKVIGQHSGLANYTIGQRKGLGLALGHPVYVIAKDSARNALIVGEAEHLAQTSLRVERMNWVSGVAPVDPIAVEVKIRYRAKAVPAIVTPIDENEVVIRFSDSVRGATAGQGAVLFDGDECLGGGIISDEGYG